MFLLSLQLFFRKRRSTQCRDHSCEFPSQLLSCRNMDEGFCKCRQHALHRFRACLIVFTSPAIHGITTTKPFPKSLKSSSHNNAELQMGISALHHDTGRSTLGGCLLGGSVAIGFICLPATLSFLVLNSHPSHSHAGAHVTFGRGWAALLQSELPDAAGFDELGQVRGIAFALS